MSATLCVCVCVHTMKGKWLELSIIQNHMQIYSAPVMIRKRDIVGTDVVHGSRSRARKMRSKVTQL